MTMTYYLGDYCRFLQLAGESLAKIAKYNLTIVFTFNRIMMEILVW